MVETALSDSATSDGGTAAAEDEALRRLSNHFATLLLSPDHADASLVFIKGDSELAIPVHRCVLAARSPFLKRHFSAIPKEPMIKMKDLVSGFDVGFDSLSAVLGYLYTGRVGPLPMEACACADEDCPHLWCRPVVDFALGVLCTSLKFEIPELVSMYQRRLIKILEHVEIDDVLLIFSVIECNDSSKRLFTKCISRIVASSNLDIVTLEKALPQDHVKKVMELQPNPESLGPQCAGFPNAHTKKIYSILDSHDFELVKLQLEEGNTSLDDTYALHYAVSYCKEEFVTQLLDYVNVDVNRRNIRGYTVLHCAAIRKEPQIIMSVLTKGARKSEVTSDGRNALQILKRLTKHVDGKKPNDQVPSTKDQLCIRILEAPEKDSLSGGPSVSYSIAGDDLCVVLADLQHRVRLAKILFPSEAELAMAIAKKGGTLEFFESSNLSETEEQRLLRKEALSRTVELGRNFFPQCSAVVDKYLDNGTELDDSDDTDGKRKRYHEIIDELSKALYEDTRRHRKKAAKR